MTDCVPDTRYMASPEFMKTTLHSFSIISFPVLTLGAYCILYKTPKQMTSIIKWLMLNLHFWSSLSDFLLCIVGIPFIFLPVPAGLGLGLIEAPFVLIYCGITVVVALTASVMAIYENRYYVLFGQNTKWRLYRKPFLTLIFTLVPLIFLPPFFNIPEQEYARAMVHEMLPCLPSYDFGGRQFCVLALSYTVPVYCMAAAIIIFGASIAIFFLLMAFNMLGIRIKFQLSRQTLNMQKAFAVSLTIQSALMLSFMLAPAVVFVWILVSWHYDQVLSNFVFIVFSLHGVASTIIMIFIHKTYREFVLSKFPCLKKKDPVLRIHSISVTSTKYA